MWYLDFIQNIMNVRTSVTKLIKKIIQSIVYHSNFIYARLAAFYDNQSIILQSTKIVATKSTLTTLYTPSPHNPSFQCCDRPTWNDVSVLSDPPEHITRSCNSDVVLPSYSWVFRYKADLRWPNYFSWAELPNLF